MIDLPLTGQRMSINRKWFLVKNLNLPHLNLLKLVIYCFKCTTQKSGMASGRHNSHVRWQRTIETHLPQLNRKKVNWTTNGAKLNTFIFLIIRHKWSACVRKRFCAVFTQRIFIMWKRAISKTHRSAG